MTTSGISGTILAVEHTGDQTVLQVATGGNGKKRQDHVILPGRREKLTSGKAIRLTNFVRTQEGALVPGENAKVTICNLAKAEESPQPKPAPQSAGIMAFEDKAARHAVFTRAVEVAREFADHIRKSGQIIKIQGRDYVTVAGWSLLPAFECANCYTVSHKVMPDGTIIAEAIVERDGQMVSRGFGACSEKDRPKIHDRLAMAQTRARGAALKSRYSVLVTLAGYESSIADEVEDATVITKPKPALQAPPPPPSLKPTKQQLDFALKMFDGNEQALLDEANKLGQNVSAIVDIQTPVLKRIVEQRVNERKRLRAEEAAKATAA